MRKAASKQLTGTFDEKYRIVRPHGSVRWIREGAFPVANADGAITHMAGVAEDITDYQQLEAQVRQAAKMESLGRLAGGVAHDFNNLLTIIRGYCSFLLESTKSDATQQAYVAEVQAAADRGAALPQQLLLFSRGQDVKPTVVDLNHIVEKLLDMLRRVVGEDVQLVTQLAADLSPVRLDPFQLEQVIINLVVNARDAMPEGGRLTIETRNQACHESGRITCVCLVVYDTGFGMDEQTKVQMFEPFFTTKTSGKGTGLGLSMVHGIVTKNEGRILVESAPQQGTAVTIEFRAHEGQAPVERKPAAKPTPTGNETILLVEDAATVRQLLREVLRSSGYRIVEAADGVEAMEQVAQYQGPIHLVISDVVMPRLNGRQLMEQMRSLRPEAQFLFMSGYMNDKVGRHGLDAPFIQKPFLPTDLLQAVRKVLQQTTDAGADT
ncbi:MAG: ATP-binding protein [Nitrospiraceae bacterium]